MPGGLFSDAADVLCFLLCDASP